MHRKRGHQIEATCLTGAPVRYDGADDAPDHCGTGKIRLYVEGDLGAGAGLIPDILIELENEQETDLKRFWANEEGKPWNEIPRWPELKDDFVDPQLERALKLLQGELVLQQIQRGSRGSRRNG